MPLANGIYGSIRVRIENSGCREQQIDVVVAVGRQIRRMARESGRALRRVGAQPPTFSRAFGPDPGRNLRGASSFTCRWRSHFSQSASSRQVETVRAGAPARRATQWTVPAAKRHTARCASPRRQPSGWNRRSSSTTSTPTPKSARPPPMPTPPPTASTSLAALARREERVKTSRRRSSRCWRWSSARRHCRASRYGCSLLSSWACHRDPCRFGSRTGAAHARLRARARRPASAC